MQGHTNRVLTLTEAHGPPLKTYPKNFFFLFSKTNSLERAFLPSNTIQAFSVVEAPSVLAVVVAISYSVAKQRDNHRRTAIV